MQPNDHQPLALDIEQRAFVRRQNTLHFGKWASRQIASVEDHMVVAVYQGGRWLILDNLTLALAQDTDESEYARCRS